MVDKNQIVKMRAEWVGSLFPFDDFVEIREGKWFSECFPEFSEKCECAEYLRDATEQEEKIWKAFELLLYNTI